MATLADTVGSMVQLSAYPAVGEQVMGDNDLRQYVQKDAEGNMYVTADVAQEARNRLKTRTLAPGELLVSSDGVPNGTPNMSPEAADLIAFSKGIQEEAARIRSEDAALLSNWQQNGGVSPTGKIRTSATGNDPSVDAAMADFVNRGGTSFDPNVYGNRFAALAALPAEAQSVPNDVAPALREEMKIANAARLAARGGKAAPTRDVVVNDGTGEHRFETQEQADAYIGSRDAAKIKAEASQKNSGLIAQAIGLQRKIKTGQLSPIVGTAMQANLVQGYGSADPRIGPDGAPNPDLAVTNPQAYAVLMEQYQLRTQREAAMKGLGNEEVAIKNQLELGKDTNATQLAIADKQAKAALKGTKLSTEAQERVAKYAADNDVKVQSIIEEGKRYGIDADKVVQMRGMDIEEKMTDAQINNLVEVTGIEKDKLKNDHNARMRAMVLASKSADKDRDLQLALGKTDAESKKYAIDQQRAMFGDEIAETVASRKEQARQFDVTSSMNKLGMKTEAKQYAANQKFVQENTKALTDIQREESKARVAQTKAELALEVAREKNRQNPDNPENKARLMEAEAGVRANAAAIAESKEKVNALVESNRTAKMQNDNLAAQSTRMSAAIRRYDDIVDPVAKMNAIEHDMENDPAVKSEIAAGRGKSLLSLHSAAAAAALQNGSKVVYAEFWSGDQHSARRHTAKYLERALNMTQEQADKAAGL